VWGKAEAEHLVSKLGSELGVDARIIRLGPLVDFNAFEPPGRLGRELGPIFVAVGGRRSRLSLCDVRTAAEVIRNYVADFDAAPPVLNLIEPNPPTRAELVSQLLKKRPDLKVIWVPMLILWIVSPLLKLLQRLIRPGREPIDLLAAFASEKYKSDLASEVIKQASAINVS
jgi:nucleoside-diphosphate-sugar epimerase